MIDVYLFSGFLGSGKTSLLLNVIRQLKEEGKKPAVFMNEFGNLPFDSDAVESEEFRLKELLRWLYMLFRCRKDGSATSRVIGRK